MLNESNTVSEATLNVLEGITLEGTVNVSDDILLANVRSAVRRPYPQLRPQARRQLATDHAQYPQAPHHADLRFMGRKTGAHPH